MGRYNKIQAVLPAAGSVALTTASTVEFSISWTEEASSSISRISGLSTVIKFLGVRDVLFSSEGRVGFNL